MSHTSISPRIDRLLAPQERYQRLEDDARRRAGFELCDLGYANVYGGPRAAVLEIIRESLSTSRPLDLQYTPYGGATITRRLVAQGLARSHGVSFGWRHLIMTPGAMAALNILFRALTTDDSPGEVILVVPSWLDYPLYLVNLGLRPVLVPVASDTLRLDVDRIADAISPATRAIVFSQPANPSGLVYSRDQLSQLAEMLSTKADNRILLISDECHRDIIFPGHRFVSPAECYDNTCVVYSFGKAFRIQGQRIGYIAVSPRMRNSEEFARLLERLCRVTGFCTPTSLMQLAVRRLLGVEIDSSMAYRRRNMVIRGLRDAGYDCPPSEGTYFLYPKTPAPDDFEFAATLAQHGLLVLPGQLFHHEGHFRISLTPPDSHIERALRVLASVNKLKCVSSRS